MGLTFLKPKSAPTKLRRTMSSYSAKDTADQQKLLNKDDPAVLFYTLEWKLEDIKAITKKLLRSNPHFGWEITEEFFISLGLGEHKHWVEIWDPKQKGSASALEIISGIIILAQGLTFKQKVTTLFSTFDFLNTGILKKQEIRCMLQVVSMALHKLGIRRFTEAEIERVQENFEKLVEEAFMTTSLSESEFERLVILHKVLFEILVNAADDRQKAETSRQKSCSEDLLHLRNFDLLCPAKAAPKNILSPVRIMRMKENNNWKSSKFRKCFKLHEIYYKHPESCLTVARSNFRERRVTINTRILPGVTLLDIFRFKKAFEDINTSKTGAVNLTEFIEAFPGFTEYDAFTSTRVFKAIDKDDSGEVSFEELFKVVYPISNRTERRWLARIIIQPKIDAELFESFRRIFKVVVDIWEKEIEEKGAQGLRSKKNRKTAVCQKSNIAFTRQRATQSTTSEEKRMTWPIEKTKMISGHHFDYQFMDLEIEDVNEIECPCEWVIALLATTREFAWYTYWLGSKSYQAFEGLIALPELAKMIFGRHHGKEELNSWIYKGQQAISTSVIKVKSPRQKKAITGGNNPYGLRRATVWDNRATGKSEKYTN